MFLQVLGEQKQVATSVDVLTDDARSVDHPDETSMSGVINGTKLYLQGLDRNRQSSNNTIPHPSVFNFPSNIASSLSNIATDTFASEAKLPLDARQAARQRRVYDVCSRIQYDLFKPGKFWTDPKEKILLCPTNKVGSTFWSALFRFSYLLQSSTDLQSAMDISRTVIHKSRSPAISAKFRDLSMKGQLTSLKDRPFT